uniref:Uncharacterized protein n=1 Tax=Rhizophora mucronata TaxID=61149 RepID=A0A2P2QU13_RHIMU
MIDLIANIFVECRLLSGPFYCEHDEFNKTANFSNFVIWPATVLKHTFSTIGGRNLIQ